LPNISRQSNDTVILNRALRLVEASNHSGLSHLVADSIPQRELVWWSNNRSIDVTRPYTKAHTLSHYAISNSALRPESHLTGISCGCSLLTYQGGDAAAANRAIYIFVCAERKGSRHQRVGIDPTLVSLTRPWLSAGARTSR